MREEFVDLPELASRAAGGAVVYASDAAPAAGRLLDPAGPAGGRDGWVTRRRREPGHDVAYLRLGTPGVVHGVVLDTTGFAGDHPDAAAVDGCRLDGYPDHRELAVAHWEPLVPHTALRPDARNAFPVRAPGRVTHLRLSLFPDGGVARLRVHGEVVPDPRLLPAVFDVAAAEHGARVEACSDAGGGDPARLLAADPAAAPGDGWATARHRGDGAEWVLVRLAAPAVVELAELDTRHAGGDAPGMAAVYGVDARTGALDDPADWFALLPSVRLQPDTRHRFPVTVVPAATHVRLEVYPDGAMARLRLHGRPDTAGLAALREAYAAAG